ncbi:Bug family tripartite tricarboxylate transporter substrate binding protein [Siccirubricoccus phaeus]|uniref:Bug family tripartite tricarboxylate transporter substrate binding protein n=1 Tax=Siccirubricoccus phaeus TaxID=2595053 RepID=UPI00165CE7F6|nr:tripartite tricarboxylate transporter substrate binding protein [Siccirubricoccus phaeus]
MRLPRRALLALPALLPAAARAEGGSWRPGQQIRIIASAAAGGTTDIMARFCAQYLQARWGTPVVVENRTGAGGTIGTLEVVRAKPDGTTLLSGNIGPQAIAYSLFRNLAYKPESLVDICGTIRGPNVLVVNAATPVRDMAGFAAWLRANPGKISYASTGVGQSTHLTPVWLLQLLNVEAIHVPFRGSAPAQVELIAGNVGFMIDNLTGVIEHIRAGRLRALAVTSAERNAELPEVPAAKETLPELSAFEVNTWFGLFGPAGLPPEITRSINADVNEMLDLPETRQRFAALGGVPLKLSPEGFADWVKAETAKWSAVIKREGLQLDAG